MKGEVRFSQITGLRGLAVLGVIAFHLLPGYVPGGFLGVVTFFVLSGFFMERKCRGISRKDLFPLYLKRIQRIYPPLLFMLGVLLVSSYFLSEQIYASTVESLKGVLLGVDNWGQLRRGMSYFDSHSLKPLKHLWALSLEIQFYLGYPLFAGLLGKKTGKGGSRRALYLFLALISALWMKVLFQGPEDTTRVYYGTDTRLFSFFIGAFFSQLQREKKMVGDCQGRTLALFLAVAGMFFFSGDQRGLYPWGLFLYSILIGYLVSLLTSGVEEGKTFLSWRFFQYLGERSYSLYLFSYPVQIFFTEFFSHHKAGPITVALLQLPLVLLLGQGGYRLFEKRRSSGNLLPLSLGLLGLLLLFPQIAPPEVSTKDAKVAIEKKLAEKSQGGKEEEKGEEKRDSKDTKSYTFFEEKILYNNKTYPFAAIPEDQWEELRKISITAVGDSVLLFAEKDLRQFFPQSYIDAKVSRQLFQGVRLLEERKKEGGFNDVLVLCLGTNGTFNYKELLKLNELRGETPLVVVNCVMPDPWEGEVNKMFQKFSRETEGVVLVDWYDEMKERKELFLNDGTHLVEEGGFLYAQMVAKGVYEANAIYGKEKGGSRGR